ncbi:porin family protein [Chitinophaga sp. Cy-1792]|uniref:porin family protein n=1 Tax=Chitinophaga sp. Cy-1792 TaxID=2608339 RepID=UPI00142243C2|nr:porin family protein [Chitinophaga sp. Cy-1792]
MKKLILSGLLAIGTLLTAQAQNINFGIKGGLNVAKMTNYDNKAIANFNAGGFVNVGLTKDWAIQPELIYSGQGADVNWNVAGITFMKGTLNTSYINIPVMVQYSIVPSFFVEAGPQIGFLLSAKIKNGSTKSDIKDRMTTADFGLGLGCGFKITDNFGVNARYVFGLSNVYNNNSILVNAESKNSVAQFGLFYQF